MKLWAFGCAHVPSDKANGRDSLASAIIDSETDFNDWDLALGLGDFASSQTFEDDADGLEVLAQFGALQNHPREAIYTLLGNHDRGPINDRYGWALNYLDPVGENTAVSGVDPLNFPYDVEGTFERYEISVGNLRILMLSDISRPLTGLRGIDGHGGDPGGVISREAYQWWLDKCEQYKNGPEIVITGSHYMLRETTAYTHDGGRQKQDGTTLHNTGRDEEKASYLGYIEDEGHKYLFREYLEHNPGACAMWLGAHTHLNPTTDSFGKGMRTNKWGCHFSNVAALSAYAGVPTEQYAKSRVFDFTDGSDIVKMQWYFHEAKGVFNKGLHPNVIDIQLPRAFVA